MKQKQLILITIVACAALLIGCAQPRPFEYQPDTEIPKGPGLFSKEAGAFALYDSKKKAAAVKQSPEKSDGAPEAGGVEESDFREFQQWRKERQDFEAFQQWKQSRQGASEYEEFREWQRWQEYKKWQESLPKDR